jgi:hypothetical protein
LNAALARFAKGREGSFAEQTARVLKSTRENPMKTGRRIKRPDAEALKKEFLECFAVRTKNTTSLEGVVKGLIEQGVSRRTLVGWAVGAGYSKGYVSSLLSRVLCSLGLREREAGAGRKPSPDALELLAHARNSYGSRFLNVLRAVWRAGRSQNSPQDGRGEKPSERRVRLNVVPQLATPSRGAKKQHGLSA